MDRPIPRSCPLGFGEPAGMMCGFSASALPSKSVQIGPFSLRNSFALAPMAGLSDVPFRTLAWRYGAGYLVSEMVSAKPELWETGKSRLRRVPVPGATPVAVQIAGTDPASMADAARRHVDDGVQIIDINFGCPAKKVCRKAAGSALLCDTALIGRIVETVAAAVDAPVTAKLRTGLVPGDGLGVLAGRTAVMAGAQALVMHGRSRACKFNGNARYDAIAELCASVDVPVLVNGDVRTAQQARAAMAATGASGVMIGRGAFGRPWLFAELTDARSVSLLEKWRTVAEHVDMMHEFYGADAGLRIARKHVLAYFEELDCAAHGAAFLKETSAAGQQAFLARLTERMCGERAAA